MVANSRAAAEQLITQGIPEARIDIIPNGIDLSMFPLRPNVARPRKIAMVACLREEKRIDVLIAAAARILAHFPDAEFQIVGDGPCREQLVAQAVAAGVLPQVRFMGHRDDVPAILSASDVFVLPSQSEASPNVIIEAMAAGLPVVASRVGGIPELVADGVTGRLVAPADPDALAAALVDLLAHPDRGAAYGRAGRACVERRYSFDRMVMQFETLYQSGSNDPASASVRNSSGQNQCPA
jgi:glycosyltransferase involved in cell wall biosynthesis